MDGAFDNVTSEIGDGLNAVGFYPALTVLDHHPTVLVVDICQCERRLGEVVEKSLLGKGESK